ncbi:MAG: hypothetical protein B7Y41_00670 [Hydrogenophilales bacterium 28-61-23]|nr:MAG: hypothetical protein B7Y41_00670 [Hydrogenophilales bacterium 28-61-23]
MTHSFWYLRHENQVFGPFPTPQIEAALKSGEVDPQWEISLNEADWISIEESNLFKEDPEPVSGGDSEESASWRDQQIQARKKWLHEDATVTEVVHDPAQDAATRNSIVRDHLRTQALLQAEQSKRTSPWVVLLAMGLIAAIGVSVWFGQHDKPIQAGIGKASDCAAGFADGLNWSACDKRGFSQPGAKAANARLDKVQLDDARLNGADLAYASLKNASLRNAELANINLSGADLSGADLSGADLTGADLRYAVLTAANLTGTRLESAKLDKATWNDGRVCAEGSIGACR